MRIDVDGGGYSSACTDFYDANHEVCTAAQKLTGVIDGCGGMAGTDAGGEAWANQYDPVAADVVKALCNATTSLASMANLLNSSLVNHKGAENGALISGPPIGNVDDGDSDPNHYGETLSSPAPPSAKGGTGDQPGWWHWIAGHVGELVWPDADTSKLRSAGNAWTDAGEWISASGSYADSAASMVGTEKSPEIPDAVAACNEIKQHLTDLGSACTTVGQACTDYAQHVDDAHTQMENELASFIEWTVGIELGGAILGALTFGAGEGAAQIAEGAEVANAASKVVAILEALKALATTVSETIAGISSKVTAVLGGLAKFLNPAVEKALVETAKDVGEVKSLEAPIRWTPVNGPGPLGEETATSFRSATYTQRTLDDETTLYRAYGGTSRELGSNWTATPIAGPTQAQLDLALNPAWGNTAEHVATIRVPAGTEVFEGAAAPQSLPGGGALQGGGSQVFIPRVGTSWVAH